VELGLSGRVVLVTGGSKGIGLACAAGFAAEGCRLALCARGTAALESAARALRGRGTEALAVPADLAEASGPKGVVDAVLAHFGQLDILVNNAGAIRGGDFLATPAEQWEEDWRLKVLGYVRMAQAVLPAMRARRWGRIVNIIGAAARNPAPTYMAGGLANAGLVNFTRALADLGAPDGILVTAINPGPTATDRWDTLIAQQARAQGKTPEALRAEVERSQPLGRIGRPEDVANLAVFLASERAGFITGVAITVDGGASRGVYL
jgi:NAD(P)-dependent dehydrogenase (short-subunit alcohol dehydrogenase family)